MPGSPSGPDAPVPDGFLDEATSRGLFDRAVEHWNAGRFFEAHEDWETLWNDAQGRERLWLQGLIQFAAAFVKFERGGASGFSRLTEQAAEKARGYVGDPHGIDFAALWRDLEPWVAHGRRVAAGAGLREGSPPSLPRIRHLPGVVPAPLPPEAHVGEDEAADDGGAR
jgi:hypothetical protein